MKITIRTAILVLAIATPNLALALPNRDVSEALRSLIEAEKATYLKLIEQREKRHGCKVAKDFAAQEADESLIPSTPDFQGIVMKAVKARDNGKFAAGLDVDALAAKAGDMSLEAASDLLHAYADSSRSMYTKIVIARALKTKCGKPIEEWVEEDGLPLPAQFTRATAEAVKQAGKFLFALESEWPINKQNAPKTDFEKKAILAVQERKPLYGEETLAGKTYFSAAYPDIAVAEACVSCHNNHVASPKRDFKLQDVMGDIVLRIPIK